ncbi:MAG: putative polyadenylate-binding protein family protein, partial [Streblomastix strix]
MQESIPQGFNNNFGLSNNTPITNPLLYNMMNPLASLFNGPEWNLLAKWTGDVSEDDLKELFNPLGAESVVMLKSEIEIDERQAQINFKTQVDAQNALDQANSKIIKGSVLEIEMQRVEIEQFNTTWKKSDFERKGKLGKGVIGSILHMKEKATSREVAIKEMDYYTQEEKEIVDREVAATLPIPSSESTHQPQQFQNILFIGDLTPETSEQDISEFFTHGLSNPDCLQSVKLCMDHNPPYMSLRYGYVNFVSQELAEKALNTLNYTNLKGQPCRLMEYQPYAQKRKSGEGNIFIQNLPQGFQTKELHDLFSDSGNIISARVSEDHGKNSIHGYIQFKTQENVDSAINKHNGAHIQGNKIKVEKYIPQKKEHKTVMIQNLNSQISEERVKQALSTYGTVTKVQSRPSKRDPQQRFVFVWFETEEEATL